MKNPDIARFIDATAGDAKLKAEWNAAKSNEDLVGVGKRHGYKFDAAELAAALKQLQGLQRGELTEADLSQVAGGATLSPTTLNVVSKSQLQFYEG